MVTAGIGKIAIAYSSSPLSLPPSQNPLEEKVRGEEPLASSSNGF
jgi:hypothetical protein